MDHASRMDGGRIESTEFRLERIKRLGNLRMEYLKRFYDRNGHVFDADRYRDGRDELHVHFRSVGSFCAVFRADHVGGGKRPLVYSTTNSSSGDIPSGCKRPVFVWIRDLLESACPIASIVRLQGLDACFMAGVDASQSDLCPALEILWSVFDQKLSSFLKLPGIEQRKFIDQIIQGGTEIVTDFSDKDCNSEAVKNRPFGFDIAILGKIGIEYDRAGIVVTLPEGINDGFQFSKVFPCPIYSCERTI